jgi:hypothetical protein
MMTIALSLFILCAVGALGLALVASRRIAPIWGSSPQLWVTRGASFGIVAGLLSLHMLWLPLVAMFGAAALAYGIAMFKSRIGEEASDLLGHAGVLIGIAALTGDAIGSMQAGQMWGASMAALTTVVATWAMMVTSRRLDRTAPLQTS